MGGIKKSGASLTQGFSLQSFCPSKMAIPSYSKDEVEIMISADEINKRVASLGKEISDHYRAILDGKPLIVICVLKGAVIFLADLVRALDVDNELEFMRFSSYQGTETTGNGRHVLVVEDILDTGHTFAHMLAILNTRSPASLRTVVLLHKHERTKKDVSADFVGFPIADKFVVGYGLDFNERLRGLPFVGVMKGSS